MKPASIHVNGRELRREQAESVRVAITHYHSVLDEPGFLGNDPHGESLRLALRSRLDEVLALIRDG